MKGRYLVAGAALLLTPACESSRTLIVESDTAWNGGFFGPRGSRFVVGKGEAQFPVEDARCWLFQKETDSGSLRVTVERSSAVGVAREWEATTDSAFGLVGNC